MSDRERSAKDAPTFTRRRFIHWAMGLGAAGTFLAMLSAANSLKPLVIQQAGKLVAPGDPLVFASGPLKGQPITRESLAVGEATLALPKGKEDVDDNIILIVRARPDEMQAPSKTEWTAEGFVAYSALCTHLNCTVLSTLRAGAIYCPCHAGVFDPRRGALVVSGPPPRPLPQLPLQINAAGELIAAGGFAEPVGVQ